MRFALHQLENKQHYMFEFYYLDKTRLIFFSFLIWRIEVGIANIWKTTSCVPSVV